jgi:hypothetical protein
LRCLALSGRCRMHRYPSQAQSIQVIRTGAVAISQLLADGTLQDEELDRAAELLISYRRARRALERDERELPSF